MARLSLSEVSKQFNIDRSTVYRAIKNGRLSRMNDGQFDMAELIRCFGEPTAIIKKQEASIKSDDATQKLIRHLETEVKKYQEREERLLEHIDRMQTLIELKSVAPTTATQYATAAARDSELPHNAATSKSVGNKNEMENSCISPVAMQHSTTTARDGALPQQDTLQSVALPQPKKRGLLSRVASAIFSDNL